MKKLISLSILFAVFACFSPSIPFAGETPKTAAEMIKKHQLLWKSATNHPFLEQAQDGSLPEKAFSTWLAQDYHFASNLLASQSIVLSKAPRVDQKLLIGGLFALDSELSWFEKNAEKFHIDLSVSMQPTCFKYVNYLLSLPHRPYVVQITGIWALERAYFDSWATAVPCQPKYKEFVDRWTNQGFRDYVSALESAVDAAMATATPEELAMAEETFRWVAIYEKDFWEMALRAKR